MEPQERDTIELGLLGCDVLGKLNSADQGPILTQVYLVKPDLESLLWGLDVSEDKKIQIH